MDWSIFFATYEERSRADRFLEAKRVCEQCTVRLECLRDAVAQGDLDGFRAGLTPKQLQRFARMSRVV